jgi:hypothetical protein
MALPKKGLRKITVDNVEYAWSATGNDGYVHLTVAPLDKEGQLLSTWFDYHPPVAGDYYSFEEPSLIQKEQHFIITPGIVRQVIDYALQKGWNPQVKGPLFHLAGKGHLVLRLPK